MPKYSKTIALGLLGIMFILMLSSSWNDSAIMDELAHIPAGYSYLTQKDFRLNPEHPPLIKDLSALPLLFVNLNFPTNVSAWQNDLNGQWEMGKIFLYQSGNAPDKIIRLSRLPIMLLALLLGWLIFYWSRGKYGDKVGLLTLFFYSLSPTFIAHSRYVTTDLAASFGFFIGIIFLIKFLKQQSRKNILLAGLAFGIAELFKFSLVLLIPIYFVLAILWVFLMSYGNFKFSLFFKDCLKIMGKIIIIGFIGILIIWLVYQFHVINYPPERQVFDTETTLQSFGNRTLANPVIWMADKPILRPLSQYLLGVLMVIQRASGGNDVYLLGKTTAVGWHYYFPLLYLVKESLAFHVLTVIALVYALLNAAKAKKEKFLKGCLEWMRDNFALTAGLILIAVYWFQSITSNLNIGLRHVMPTFPFIYLLTARGTVLWLSGFNLPLMPSADTWTKIIFILKKFVKTAPRYLLLGALMLWLFLSNLFAFPYYLSYYNELVGIKNGYKIAVDSNYDWGQDLKRLKTFVEKNNINKIKLDYFGGGSPNYYLGEKFLTWQSLKGAPSKGGWFAVSATLQQNAMGKPVKGFKKSPEDTYSWLKNKAPVARAGTSIFIYKF